MASKSNEKALFVCTPAMSAIIPFAAAGLAVFAVFYFAGSWQAGAALGGLAVLGGFVSIKSCGITITEENIRCGKTAVPLEKIESVYCGQSIIGKLLGYGSVIISAEGKSRVFGFLPRADEVKNEISKQADLCRFKRTCREAELAKKMME